MTALLWVAAIAISYVAGSIPFGYLTGKLCGVDVRQHGSGNVGATNIARVINIPAGITVFALDVGKGVFAAGVIPALLGGEAVGKLPLLCGAAAILGHILPVFLSFKGGRGVATAFGVLACITPIAIAVAMGAWIVVMVWTRYVSAASITAAVAAPLLIIGLHLNDPGSGTGELLFTGIIAFIIILRHIPNIKRLLAGTEHRVK